MPNGIYEFEKALYGYLTENGIERVYSQRVPQEGRTPAVMLRESGSTTENELEGSWPIVTASYEVACLTASRDSPTAEVSVKQLSDQVFALLESASQQSTIGTDPEVRLDSLISIGHTTRQFDDTDKGGTVFLYSQRWAFNFDSREVTP